LTERQILLIETRGDNRDQQSCRLSQFIPEIMQTADRRVDERARAGHEAFSVDVESEFSLEKEKGLFLPAVSMRRRAAAGGARALNRAYLPSVSSAVARKR
jgi:hypothetical protein